jgi:ribosome-associated translation inhibitor RaiA
MQVHFSYHNVPRTTPLDKVIQAQIRKLDKLLIKFSPDLVHLHGLLEANSKRKNTVCSLNLALPTGQLHTRQEGENLLADLQAAFDHLIDQVKKHKRGLRREEEWHRKRPARAAAKR